MNFKSLARPLVELMMFIAQEAETNLKNTYFHAQIKGNYELSFYGRRLSFSKKLLLVSIIFYSGIGLIHCQSVFYD